MTITVDQIKNRIRRARFTDVRIDRLAHATGFRRPPAKGELNSDALRRSIGPGSNRELILKENEGIEGPIFVEVGYGNQTVRVRLYRGYQLCRVWDVYTYWPQKRLSDWTRSFNAAVGTMLAEDRLTREEWARDHS